MFAPWLTDPLATLGTPERFIAFPENQFALSALQRITQAESRNRGHGLLTFLHGPAGAGKSHLVRTSLRRILDQAPRSRLLLASAVDLAETLEAADELGTWSDVMSAIAGHAVVVCEDLHELPPLGGLQERLSTLWDQLLEDGRQLVVTSRMPAAEIEGLSLRLANRLHGGLTAGIRLPGEEGRSRLIEHFGSLAGIAFGQDAISLAGERLTGSPREIRGAIETLARRIGRRQDQVTAAQLEQLWQQPSEVRLLSFEQIVTAVAIEFGLPSTELTSRSRQQTLIVPRQVAMSLTRELTGQSLERIGAFYGRTHTTVAHGCERLREQLKQSQTLRQQVLSLKRRLQRMPQAECG